MASSGSPAGLRALQAQSDPAQVTVVTGPEELMNAVEGGAQYIEVQDHMSLTQLEESGTHGLISDDLDRSILVGFLLKTS